MAKVDRSYLLRRFPALHQLALRRRRRIPYIQQSAAADCGAACLTMVLGRYGKRVALREVSEIAGVSERGTSAALLLEAGRHYGLRGRGVKIDEIDDLRLLEPGSILHWRLNHLVVLERFDRRGARIIDPALGRRTIGKPELARSFTGVALTFEPGEDFAPGKSDHKRGMWRYLRQVFAQPDLISRILVSSLVIQILALAVPILTGLLVDHIVPKGVRSLLGVLAIGLVGLFGFQLFSSLIRSFLMVHLRTRLDAKMTLEFLDHLVDLPYRYFQQRSAGDLMMRLNSNTLIREILTSSGISGMFDGVMATAYLALLLLANPKIGLLVALLGLVRIGLFVFVRKRQRDLMSESLQVQADSRGYQVQMLTGMETLKACGAEHRSAEQWSHLFVKELNVSLTRGRLDAVIDSLLSSLATASPLVILLYGGSLVLSDELTLGTMLALNALAQGFLVPLSTLIATAFQLQLMGSYIDRINDVMQTPREQEAKEVRQRPSVSGNICLHQVTFRYAPLLAPAVLDATVEIAPGQVVAVVGGSGSGKSTLASLLAGLYHPQSGRILYGGTPLQDTDLLWLRGQMGYVPQHPFLFGVSIRANIGLPDPTLPLHRIVEAARLACIDEEIEAMPMTYETMISDGGSSLSGGQRQRIALARALVHRPKLLILDEATSALDAVTESRVHDNLTRLGCTRIVIAHRLSTVREADLILVMDAGEISERGSHAELLAAGGKYAELVSIQMETAD